MARVDPLSALITRRSQVQILPPLLESPGNGAFPLMTTGMVKPFASFERLVPWVESWGPSDRHPTLSAPTDIREELDTLDERHPDLVHASVRCSTCGNAFTTRSTRSEIVVDVCSSCHPAYTGIERAVARGGRIERFERRRAQSRAA